MEILEKIDALLYKLFFIVVTALGILLISIVFFGVLRRYILNAPLVWGYELSILLFMWVGFLSMSMGFQKNRHRSITFIIDKIKDAQKRKVTEIALAVVITAILVACTVTGILVFMQMYPRSFRTLNLSLGWQFLPLPFAFTAMTITSLKNMVRIAGQPKDRIAQREASQVRKVSPRTNGEGPK